MAARIVRWKAHNSLRSTAPMILVFPEGSWRELLPPEVVACTTDATVAMELELRRRIYTAEHFVDDTVCSDTWTVPRAVVHGSWGLEPKRRPSTEEHGAWAFQPVVQHHHDVEKLHGPEIHEDTAESARRLTEAEELFGDLLHVRQVGVAHVSFHLMNQYTALRGLEQVMWDMIDEPEWLHDAMARLEAAHHERIRRYVELDLLTLNNDNTYHSSGGNGWIDDLPQPDFAGTVRPADIWASAEAQEMAQVSPAMHEEFILQYERRLLAPFGLNGYGCCEDLTRKLDTVKTIPNIRRISCAPWCDVPACAEQLTDKYILSWKPNPAHLVGTLDEDHLRRYLGAALDAARGCVFEMILKDTHTCEHRPERFDRWTAIARELVTERA